MRKTRSRKPKFWSTISRINSELLILPIIKFNNLNKKVRHPTFLGVQNICSQFYKKITSQKKTYSSPLWMLIHGLLISTLMLWNNTSAITFKKDTSLSTNLLKYSHAITWMFLSSLEYTIWCIALPIALTSSLFSTLLFLSLTTH